MTGKIDILEVEADILRKVAEKVVFTNIARLEDGVQERTLRRDSDRSHR